MNPGGSGRNEPMTAVVWGASGHATVVEDCARTSGAYRIVGFIDELHPERRGDSLCGLPILGGREALEEARAAGASHVLLGVGNNAARLRIADAAEAANMLLGMVVHPAATVAGTATVERGAVIAAGAIVGPGARIGRAAIVNTSASVDHHCRVGEAAHVAPGVLMAGAAEVGRLAWIGIGSVLIEGVRVGAGAFIGAGALVLSDVPDDVVAYGLPARPIRPTPSK